MQIQNKSALLEKIWKNQEKGNIFSNNLPHSPAHIEGLSQKEIQASVKESGTPVTKCTGSCCF